MSIRIMTTVWSHSKATGTTLLVLLALADIADDNGECWPSMGHLGQKCRIDVRTARRQIRLLEEIDEVVVVRGGGKASTPGGTRSNRYRIVVHIPEPEAAESGDLPYSDKGGDLTDSGVDDLLSRAPVSGVVGHPCPQNRQLPVSETPPLAPAVADAGEGDLSNAVLEVCGLNPADLTPSANGAMGKALADLRAVGATATGVRQRAEAFAKQWPEATLTPLALAKHWPRLGRSSGQVAKPIETSEQWWRWGAKQSIAIDTEAELRDLLGAATEEQALAAIEGWSQSRVGVAS